MDPSEIKEIIPIDHPLDASVVVPGSKSLTNRALMISALAKGQTILQNALFSDDSRYFSDSLLRLGFDVVCDETARTIRVKGQMGRIPAARAEFYIGNAGTAARFLTALVSLGNGVFRIDGDKRMQQRPIEDLVVTLSQFGVDLESAAGCLPVTIRAKGLSGGYGTIAGNVSSQFLSGLLMAAPYAEGAMELTLTGVLNSRPYVDMTLGVMADFGVTVQRKGYESFSVQPTHYSSPGTYQIESDASAASYFFAAPAILGGTVRVQNITAKSKQGDLAFLQLLEKMGCIVKIGHDYIAVTGPARLRGLEVDMRDISDTAQTLAAIAPFADSATHITGIGFIRSKETDRIAAVCTELRDLGVHVEEEPDGMVIYPSQKILPGLIHTYNDHRMAMAFSLIGIRVPGITIENPGCVSKTFPDYFQVLETLR
jgi:3-phosphoshikimate 1-carboxyvinyltransferase